MQDFYRCMPGYEQAAANNTMFICRKLVTDMMQVIDSLQQQKQSVKDQRWFDGMITQTVLSIVSYVATHCCEMKGDVVRELKEKKLLPLRSYHVLKNNILKIKLLNISPYLLFYYYRMI